MRKSRQYKYLCIYMYQYVYMCMYIYIYMCVCRSLWVYVYIHTYIHIDTYICICICISAMDLSFQHTLCPLMIRILPSLVQVSISSVTSSCREFSGVTDRRSDLSKVRSSLLQGSLSTTLSS